jgi:hypothetical protein
MDINVISQEALYLERIYCMLGINCNSDMNYALIMRWKKMLGKSRMDTPKKLAALGT